MKLIYTHANAILVQNAKNIVMNEGIDITIKNEFLGGGLGELSAVDSWLELWVVNTEDYERATLALACLNEEAGEQAKGNNEVAEQADWTCSNCKEKNYPSFGVCWNCQHKNTVS